MAMLVGKAMKYHWCRESKQLGYKNPLHVTIICCEYLISSLVQRKQINWLKNFLYVTQ
jgi:hypothetical protein